VRVRPVDRPEARDPQIRPYIWTDLIDTFVFRSSTHFALLRTGLFLAVRDNGGFAVPDVLVLAPRDRLASSDRRRFLCERIGGTVLDLDELAPAPAVGEDQPIESDGVPLEREVTSDTVTGAAVF
jgi:hypothetical protein